MKKITSEICKLTKDTKGLIGDKMENLILAEIIVFNQN